MKTKRIISLAIVMAIVVLALFLLRDNRNGAIGTGESTSLIVGSNAIYVDDQLPGRSVSIAMVRLEKPGFVVIHEDNAGKPGKFLGISGALPMGETKKAIPIGLSRMTKDGETLYAMLHLGDGDGVFDSAKDKPVLDSLSGQPVMMIFTASLDASEPGAINL